MKRKINPTHGLIILILVALSLALVACERPLQPEAVATAEAQPTADPAQPTIEPPPTAEVPPPEPPPDTGGETDTGGDTPPAEDSGTEVETPPEEDTGETTEEAPAGDGTYTVQAGDTLYSIAISYGVTVDEMVAANNLANPDILEVGQVLIIPGAGETGSGDEGADGEGDVTPEQVYTIQPGDTLGRIGQRFGFTAEELAAYNNMDVNDIIYVGDELLIPPSDYSLPEEGEEGGEGEGSG